MHMEKLYSHEIFDTTSTSTVYGERFLHAKNPVVFIAPHGVDDLYTAEIVRELARNLDSGYMINTQFSRRQYTGIDPELIQDFNRPHFPSVDGTFLFESSEGYTQFLHDYHCLSHILLVQYPSVRPVIFHIHGMKNTSDSLIDIGIGIGEFVSQDIARYTRGLSEAILSIDHKA